MRDRSCCQERAGDSVVWICSGPSGIENDVTVSALPMYVVDPRKLRASLRLCFPAEQADALAARLIADEVDPTRALAPVLRLARLRFGTDRWLALIRPNRSAPPLHPRPGLTSGAALALALHLGLDLDVRHWRASSTNSVGEIAVELCRARQEVDPEHLSPCPDFASQIGRYRDPVMDRPSRLELLQHLEGCARCHLALERAREIDALLISTVEQFERTLDPERGGRRSRIALWLGPALLWGSVAILLLSILTIGVAGSRRVAGAKQYARAADRARCSRATVSWLAARDHAVRSGRGVQRRIWHTPRSCPGRGAEFQWQRRHGNALTRTTTASSRSFHRDRRAMSCRYGTTGWTARC